jgi:hypothetical protein
MIKSDREPRVNIDSQNRASQVLAEMAAGKDSLESIDMKSSDSRDENSEKTTV